MKTRIRSTSYEAKRKRSPYRSNKYPKYTTDDGISKLLNFQWIIVFLSVSLLFILKIYSPQIFLRVSENLTTLINEEGIIDVEAEIDNISQQCASILGKPTGGMGGLFPVKITKDPENLNFLPPPNGASLSPIFLTCSPKLPLDDTYVTSPYGYRIHPLTNELDFHTGTDLAADAGTPVHSILYGKIYEVGQSAVFGNYVVIEHSPNLKSVYCHCSEIIAPVGAYVKQGDRIALVGSTGVSTGPHLHLEIIVNSSYTDPAWIFKELQNEI